MENKLQGWLAPNTLTEDPDDQILVLKSAGTVTEDDIVKEMISEDTGLRKETLVHSVTLYNRIIARFLANGNNVNTGLFYATPRATGIIEDGIWNPEKIISTLIPHKTVCYAKKSETQRLKSWAYAPM